MSDPAWSAQQHAALRRVVMIVAGTTSPEEVFATVAAEVGSVLGAEFTSMVRYESPTSAAIRRVGYAWPRRHRSRRHAVAG